MRAGDTFRLPASDPRSGYLAHREEIDRAIARVLASGRYILGPEVEAFEREFAAYLGVGHVVGVASGTEALQLALRAAGIGPGDIVMTTAFTSVATVAAIELSGAGVHLVDVEERSLTIDAGELAAALDAMGPEERGRVKAVVPVHLFGHPADVAAITALAGSRGLAVIEDCAQSHGARLSGRMTGSWGLAGAFSFYPTKNLGALGDGGAVATDDAQIAAHVRQLRQYGWRADRTCEIPGMNSRLDEVQAAVLRVKLRHLEADNARRAAIAATYDRALAGTRVKTLLRAADAQPVFHQYVVRAPMRDSLRAHLERNGIGTLVHYPRPIHREPAYAGRIRCGRAERAEEASASVLSLPMHPQLTDEQALAVARAVAAW